MEKLFWKNFKGESIESIESYVLNYIRTIDRQCKIIVGADSSNHGRKTTYAVTVVFYNEQKRHGAHVVFARFRVPKIKDVATKIRKEVEYIYTVADSIDNEIRGEYFYKFDKNYYDDSIPTRLVEVHVDVNPKKSTKNGRKMTNNKSNSVYTEVMGWLCAMGFKVISKPCSFAATNCSDKICAK